MITIKSKYKYVSGTKYIGKEKIYWRNNMRNVSNESFDTEREAAISVDKCLIKKGKKPVNILIPKK